MPFVKPGTRPAGREVSKMNARVRVCVFLISVVVFAVFCGCRSDSDRVPARERQLAAAKAKWPNPFDEMRHYADIISEKDRKIIDASFPDDTDWAILRGDLAEAIRRNEKSVKGITSVVRSGRINEYVLIPSEMDSLGSDSSILRWSVRFLCNAAIVAHDGANPHEAAERLVAAVKLADSVGMSDETIWYMVRYVCLNTAYSAAHVICRYEGIDAADAADLSYVFSVAADAPTYMAELRSIWTRAGDFRDFNTYIAIFGEPHAAAESVAPEDKSASVAPDIVRGAMNLSAKDLRDSFRRDVEANDNLRRSVLATASWPYYTLPKDDFWTALMNRGTDSRGLPMTAQAEQYVAYSVEWSNNELARSALLDIVFAIRAFEAARNRLPETLDELASYVAESMAADKSVCFPLLGFIDVYSGEPYKYAVARDAAGKAMSFKVYSVGIDLKDDGGVERTGEERKTLGSDIVFAGEPPIGKH
jgi:hypothetical protein